MANHSIGSIYTRLGTLTAHPAAFVVVGVFGLLWLVFGEKFGWQEAATFATLVMTLIIQRAEHRDTQALHAKLDELLRAKGEARTELIGMDEQEPEDIEDHRKKMRASA